MFGVLAQAAASGEVSPIFGSFILVGIAAVFVLVFISETYFSNPVLDWAEPMLRVAHSEGTVDCMQLARRAGEFGYDNRGCSDMDELKGLWVRHLKVALRYGVVTHVDEEIELTEPISRSEAESLQQYRLTDRGREILEMFIERKAPKEIQIELQGLSL